MDLPSIEIGPSMPLPDVCMRCGQPTRRRTCVKRVGPSPPAEEASDSSCRTALGCLPTVGCLFTVGFLIADLFERRGPRPPVVRIRVPWCPECARQEGPTPLDVDFERRRFRFDVHPRFFDWLEQTARRPMGTKD